MRHAFTISLAPLVAFALLVLANHAVAADYESRASTTVSNVQLTGEAGISYDFYLDFPSIPSTTPPPPNTGTTTSMSGNGVATIDEATNGTDIFGFGTNVAHVSGSATAVPGIFSSSMAGVEMHDFVEVDNTAATTDDAVLTFQFDYTVESEVNASINELAGAIYNIHITGATDEPGESLEVDLTGTGSSFTSVTDFEVNLARFTDLGDSGTVGPISDSILVRYSVAPPSGPGTGISQFSIFTRASGGAQTVVPEPASVAIWSLLGIGLLAFTWRNRRRRAA